MALSVNGQKVLTYEVSAKITRKKNDDRPQIQKWGQVLGMNSSLLSKNEKKKTVFKNEAVSGKTLGIGSFLHPFSNQKRTALNTKAGHKKGTPLKIKEIVILNSPCIMGRLRGARATATTLCDQQ